MEISHQPRQVKKGYSMKGKIFGVALALASGVFAQQAFAADGGSLYFGLSGEPSTLESTINAGAPARTIRLAIHRGLFNYGPDGKLSSNWRKAMTSPRMR